MGKQPVQVYETTARNGSTYRFEDDGNWVSIAVNGKDWGASDGNRFIRALLHDIRKLRGDDDFNKHSDRTYK